MGCVCPSQPPGRRALGWIIRGSTRRYEVRCRHFVWSSCSAQASAAWGRAALQMHWDGPGPMLCSGTKACRCLLPWVGKHLQRRQNYNSNNETQQQNHIAHDECHPCQRLGVVPISYCQPGIAAEPIHGWSYSFTDERSWRGPTPWHAQSVCQRGGGLKSLSGVHLSNLGCSAAARNACGPCATLTGVRALN